MRKLMLAMVLSVAGPWTAGAQIPENAQATSWGKRWECVAGFVERGRRCIPVARATDNEIRQVIIQESVAAYSGSCPCPYFADRAGRSCGRRSAYSRPGGAAPLCYASDVSAMMVRRYRERDGG